MRGNCTSVPRGPSEKSEMCVWNIRWYGMEFLALHTTAHANSYVFALLFSIYQAIHFLLLVFIMLL